MLPDLLRTVVADLIYLRQAWDQEADDDRLRRDSVVLRRLLVHKDLQTAWTKAGFGPKEPRIEASTLQPLLDTVPLDRIFFAAAGGAQYKGATVALPCFVYEMTQEEIQKMYAAGGDWPRASFGLEAFNEAPAVVVQGTTIPRRVLLKYVSEKLGGAHHDERRDEKGEGLLYALLDQVDTVLSAGKPAIYFELLSAGQALTRSPDIAKLIAA
jgi:hypothetical protein